MLLHMRPNLMAQQNSHSKAFAKLYDESVCPEDLILLSKADCMGMGAGLRADYARTEALLRAQLAEYRARMARPHVTGADLIAAGMEPGEALGEALRYAHKLRLAGVEKASALKQTLAFARKGS